MFSFRRLKTQQKSVLVINNASHHRKGAIYDIADEYGFKVILLLPYSLTLIPLKGFGLMSSAGCVYICTCSIHSGTRFLTLLFSLYYRKMLVLLLKSGDNLMLDNSSVHTIKDILKALVDKM